MKVGMEHLGALRKFQGISYDSLTTFECFLVCFENIDFFDTPNGAKKIINEILHIWQPDCFKNFTIYVF